MNPRKLYFLRYLYMTGRVHQAPEPWRYVSPKEARTQSDMKVPA